MLKHHQLFHLLHRLLHHIQIMLTLLHKLKKQDQLQHKRSFHHVFLLHEGIPYPRVFPFQLRISEVVDFDIATIEKLGVTFKFNETIDAARLEELKAEYDAVFVGTGLWKSKVIDIPGKDLDGVVSAIDFLKDAR